MNAERIPVLAHLFFLDAHHRSQALVGEALLFEPEHFLGRHGIQRNAFKTLFDIDKLLDLHQEPGINRGHLLDFLDRHADAECICHIEDALRTSFAQFVHNVFAIRRDRSQAVLARFQSSERLLQRFLESRADSHHLADRLHLRREAVICLRELFKGKARHLGDHVVDRRLKGSRRLAPRNVVVKLIERVAHGKLGGNLGNREPRCL